jgi:predicted phage-related endonuclease
MQRILKEKHGSKEWLLSRWRDEQGRCVFGASDVPVLMGASPYKTRGELFADKLNQPEVQPDSAVFRRGNLLEKPLLESASDFLGVNISTPEWVYREDRFSVSLDGVDHWDEPSVVVEAKTTTRYSINDATDLPAEWLWQGWTQQAVLNCPVWFSVLDRDLKISMVCCPENREAIDSLRLEAEVFGDWIDQGVVPDEELNNFSADDITRIYKVEPTSVELDVVVIDWLVALEDARQQGKQATEMETKAKDAIAQMLKGNEVGLVNGVQVVS